MMRAVLMSIVAFGLLACSEKDQSLYGSGRKTDAKPWQAAPTPYTVKGWTAGDKTSWENQTRSRAQSQNEYIKVN